MTLSLNMGISSDDFRSEYFERKAVIFRKGGINFLDPPLDLAGALSNGHHTDGRVNVFLNGPLPFDMFTETYQDVSDVKRRICLDKVEELLSRGATIAVNRIDRTVNHIRRICDDIQDFTKEIATANCYAATSGNGSFGRHWDTHDVLALQLAGRKQWKVWAPTYYHPIAGQSCRKHSYDPDHPPVFDITLETGDILYLPRGWWHEATPIEHERTIHLAIGLHASTMSDYISWLATNVLIKEQTMRRSFGAVTENVTDLQMALSLTISAARDPKHIAAYSDLHGHLLRPSNATFRDIQI